MELMRSPQAFQQIMLSWRSRAQTLALVPTMGALHEGHFRLIEEAHNVADRVIVSIFVNPIQFGPNEDLDKYPRMFEHDAQACRERGVDIVFSPSVEEMYPEDFETVVIVKELTQPLCGTSRPGHFRGVTTVVAKLFMLTQPTHAIFGWKDAQQFLVLRRMARDLAMPIEMIGVETVREPDGLALSSRNAYLSEQERLEAPLIYQGLKDAKASFDSGERDAWRLLGYVRRKIDSSSLLTIEYLEARSLETLLPLEKVTEDMLIAVAVRLGNTRLIDNLRLLVQD